MMKTNTTLFALMLFCACASPKPDGLPAAPAVEHGNAPAESGAAKPEAKAVDKLWSTAAWPAGEWIGEESNSGTYWVEWRAIGEWVEDGEMPLNDDFSLEVRLFDAESKSQRPLDAELVVTARMPTHGHGMKHDSRVIERVDGSMLVTGMLMHMTGPWELYFDVRRGPHTERAQHAFEME
ncbi:MAG: hypothetical protein ACI835_005428 [Planctomycetota bacterium]|jgi:hypothetical protein